MNDQTRDYLRRRELAERTAAKKATCDAARRVHQELAQGYAERLRGAHAIARAANDSGA